MVVVWLKNVFPVSVLVIRVLRWSRNDHMANVVRYKKDRFNLQLKSLKSVDLGTMLVKCSLLKRAQSPNIVAKSTGLRKHFFNFVQISDR